MADDWRWLENVSDNGDGSMIWTVYETSRGRLVVVHNAELYKPPDPAPYVPHPADCPGRLCRTLCNYASGPDRNRVFCSVCGWQAEAWQVDEEQR